ncbi:hypothetical protein [Streptomyces monashensis]|nr:hypothetical protein [Streptomyces monashensis]
MDDGAGRRCWTAVRLEPGDDVTAVTTVQLREATSSSPTASGGRATGRS